MENKQAKALKKVQDLVDDLGWEFVWDDEELG